MKEKYKEELKSIEFVKEMVLDYIRDILDKYEIKFISRKKFNQKYQNYPRKTTVSLCDADKRVIYLVKDDALFKKDERGRLPHEFLEAILLDPKIYNCTISKREESRRIRHKDIHLLERNILNYIKK